MTFRSRLEGCFASKGAAAKSSKKPPKGGRILASSSRILLRWFNAPKIGENPMWDDGTGSVRS